MLDWKDHLKPEEAARLAEIAEQNRDNAIERRRIKDRCRKRLDKSLKEKAQ